MTEPTTYGYCMLIALSVAVAMFILGLLVQCIPERKE